MIALPAVQQKAVDLIAASSVWAGESVLKDDGKQEQNEETALKNNGHCAVVMPLLDGDTLNQGGNIAQVDVEFSVRISINPKKATKDIYDLLVAAKQAVCGWVPPAHPNERFRLGKRAFVIIPDEDEGLMSYLLFFEKTCVF